MLPRHPGGSPALLEDLRTPLTTGSTLLDVLIIALILAILAWEAW